MVNLPHFVFANLRVGVHHTLPLTVYVITTDVGATLDVSIRK